jgi:hypothetical protein
MRRRSTGPRPDAFALAMGAAAAFAPASLTGIATVDVIERVLFAGGVAYVGAHGRRWSWLVSGAVVASVARGPSLAIAVASLAVLVLAMAPKRRVRAAGALGIGGLANALLWLPPGTSSLAIGIGLLGLIAPLATGLPYLRTPKRRVARAALWGVAGVMGLSTVLLAAAMALAYGDVREGSDQARIALEAARDGDGDRASIALGQGADAFTAADARLRGPLAAPARVVPGLAQQLRAVEVTVDQGLRIARSADALVATADYDGLQYDGQLDLDQVQELEGPGGGGRTHPRARPPPTSRTSKARGSCRRCATASRCSTSRSPTLPTKRSSPPPCSRWFPACSGATAPVAT